MERSELAQRSNDLILKTEGDTLPGYRSMDCFFRPDGRTYFDPKRLKISQADEKQRFIDAQGRMLPIYQTTTQWPDKWFANHKMTVQQMVKGIEYGMFITQVTQVRVVARYESADQTSKGSG